MKVIITESQLNMAKHHDKFINYMVKNTKIFNFRVSPITDFRYVGNILYPYNDNIYDISFHNDSRRFTFTMPPKTHMNKFTKLIGVDYHENPQEFNYIYDEYSNRIKSELKQKIKKFLNENIDQ